MTGFCVKRNTGLKWITFILLTIHDANYANHDKNENLYGKYHVSDK